MVTIRRCATCDATFVGSVCPTCILAPTAQAAEVTDVLEPGSRFRDFEIVELLGRGGMGVVYKARQPHLNRFVALKILPPLRALDPHFEARFEREAKAMAGLVHPNIVTIHDSGKEGGLYFLSMEFVEHASLRTRIAEKRLTPGETERIFRQILDAVEFAHRRGVVHRDIKPENILIDSEGRAKLADFGLAKVSAVESEGVTDSFSVVGTVKYMAPEQMEEPKTVDHRADVYALGIVLHEMTHGTVPPLGYAVQPPAGALDAVLKKAVYPDRARRYQTVAEFREAWERAIGPARRRFPWVAVLPVVILGALAAWILTRARPAPGPKPEPVFRFEKELKGHADAVKAVAFRGDRLTSSSYAELREWEPERSWKIECEWIAAIATAGDATVFGADDGALRIWRDGTELRRLPGHRGKIAAVAVSGSRIATGAGDKTIRLWGLDGSGGPVLDAGSEVLSLAFAPDGTLASGHADRTVRFWKDSTEVSSIRDLPGPALALAHAGSTLAIAAGDAIRLGKRVLKGHTGPVLGLASNGNRLASVGRDKTVRIWDVATGRELQRLEGHSGPVICVAFRGDGRLLATGSADRTLRLWTISDQ